jgi:hydrogenase maturation protease
MQSGITPNTAAGIFSAFWTKRQLSGTRDRRQGQPDTITSRKTVALPRRILVIGTGNPLRTDGGVGTRTVETLQAFFEFSPNVTFVRDWEQCRGLLQTLMESDGVIVVDAVRTGSRPGTLHRITDDRLRRTLSNSDLPHQVTLVDTLSVADILGRPPEMVIVAIEPENVTSPSTQLTERVELRIPDLVASVVAEVERMGGECTPKHMQPHPLVALELVSA